MSSGLDEEIARRLQEAAASGELAGVPRPEFADEAAVTIVLASEGYPAEPVTGRPIAGVEAAGAVDGVTVLHAATATSGDGLIASGGRVLSVVATGEDFAQARHRGYEALGLITLEGGHYRSDIAAKMTR